MNNDIKFLLGLTDPNITFDPKCSEHSVVDQGVCTWNLYLTYETRCELCGFQMVKNGTKTVTHTGPRSGFHFQNLRIRKQKFLCRYCGHTSIARCQDINPNNHILDCVKQSAAMELSENVSQKHIAKDHNISPHTVMRTASGLFVYNKPNFNYLPQHLSFDDFKAGDFSMSGMSIVLIDSATHRPLDVIRDRAAGNLRTYFEQYTWQARKAVKTITIDLFTPYRKIVTDLFPNAKIIADKFHVITQVHTALNTIRIQVMNQFGANTPEYRQLKKFWKLILKNESDLDYTTRKKRVNFKYAFLTDKDVIDRLLALSDELKDAYHFYQEILSVVAEQDSDELSQLLYPDKQDIQYNNLPQNMKKARHTLRKHFDEILNMFTYQYSNGPIEGINNKIKVIKRTAYGFRNFGNFRLRILISFKNSFYAMNYETKAANSKMELAA